MSAILNSLFSICSKLKRWKSTLSKWVLHELTENKKNLCFEVLSSFTLRNHKESFLDRIVMIDEKWILYDNCWWPEKAPKHFPKPNLPPPKSHSHCLVVCCWSDPLQVSEFQWNHCIWEVCSANWWDVPKITIPAASISQQKGPNFLHNNPQTHISQPMYQKLMNWATKFCFTCLIHLTPHNWLPSLQESQPFFCRENASTINRRQKMLSKN